MVDESGELLGGVIMSKTAVSASMNTELAMCSNECTRKSIQRKGFAMTRRSSFAVLAVVVLLVCSGVTFAGQKVVEGFAWKDTKGQYMDLTLGGKKVARFMYGYDESSEQRRFETYKPLLHVYGADGQRLTNGPDGESEYPMKGIQYPHHRAIFIGWNKLTHGGKSYDLWHMKGVEQVHQKFIEATAGSNSVTLKSLIHWRDSEDKPVIVEEREMTISCPGGAGEVIVDFITELKAVRGDVFLGGDPEHAGFQYRAHDDVGKGAAEKKATYLFHKDGIDPKKDTDLPWVAMSYGLGEKRYSVLHMSHPANPGASKYSAYRDYGRFGIFFTKEIPAGQTLKLKYRIWVAEGQMPERDALAAMHAGFVKGSGGGR